MLDRVQRGEQIIITRDGDDVAELRSVRKGLSAEALIERVGTCHRWIQKLSAAISTRSWIRISGISDDLEDLLDTSTLILLERFDPRELPRKPMISAVTLAELAVGPLVAESDPERLLRQSHLLLAEADFDPIPFDDQAARAFGAVSANLRKAGRKLAARTFDAMIATIVISRGLPLFTATPRPRLRSGLFEVSLNHRKG